MRVKIDGRELPAKNLDKARVRDIVELQRQTGWKMQELRTQMDTTDILGYAIVIFLTLRNAGAAPTWDECLDRGMTEIEFIQEPGDETPAEEDASEPQLALESSSEGDAEPAPPTE